MYFREPGKATSTLPPLPSGLKAALWACTAGTLVLGIFPSLVLDFVGKSAAFVR
jgi:NADH:ubiquinone oxidoreductase subunit 2 (subunit N)